MAGLVLGIDLGTARSCVAVVRDGKAEVLRDGERTTVPSCLCLQGGKELVGDAALRQAVTDPQNTVSAVKRLIGHPYESPEVQAARGRVSYSIGRSPTGSVVLDVGGRELTPVQVSARILARVKAISEKALGQEVTRAVISVPAHFNDAQRKATRLAAEYAGIEAIRLINEPTAAAFAYGYKRGEDFSLAVYDLGGGTFDITVLRSEGDRFEVLATDGDSYLGGEDFDFAITDWLASEFAAEHGEDLTSDPAAMLRIKEAAERAKIELSERTTAKIDLPMLAPLADGTRVDFSCEISREQLTELVKGLVERTIELSARCLAEADVGVDEIDEVLLVGGQSRMPCVRDACREFFGREPRRDMNPDEVVALGTALYAYSLVADDLGDEAVAAAGDAYGIALKSTEVARRLLSEVEKLEQSEHPGGDRALRDRIAQLLQETKELDPELLVATPPVIDASTKSDPPREYAPDDLQKETTAGGSQREPLEFDDDPTPVSLASAPSLSRGEPPALTVSAFEPNSAEELALDRPEPELDPDLDVPAPESPEPDLDVDLPGQVESLPELRARSRTAVESPAAPTPPAEPAREVPPTPASDRDDTPARAREAEPPAQAPPPAPAARPEAAAHPPKPAAPAAPARADSAGSRAAATDVQRRRERALERSPEDLPARLPDESQLPTAVDNLDHELQGLSERAKEMFDRIGDVAEGEDGPDKELSALLEAASFLTDKIDFAADATREAQEQLDAAAEHRNARRVELVDVTSHGLGIAAALDLFSVLIPHNTPVPTEVTKMFTTTQDGQREVEIKAYQGRERQASQNHLLGSFILEGLPPAPRMSPRIDVRFTIDADGILRVSAREQSTGRDQSIRVEDPLGLQQANPADLEAGADADPD